MKKFLMGALLMMAAAACSSVQVSYDYDKQADFSKYKTYAFTEESLNLPVDQLNRDRLLKAVETELTAKGFTKSESPDAWVQLAIKTAQRTEAVANTTGGYGYGYGRYGYGGGFSTTTVDYNQYTDGTLFVSLVDKTTEKIVWMGRGTKTIDEHANAEKKEANITYAVKQIFMNYPPKSK